VRVLLLARYGRMGSSSRVRSYQFVPYLASRGVEVTAAPLLSDDYLRDLYSGRPVNWLSVGAAYARRLGTLLACRRFDLAWVEKELFPWAPAWGEALLSRLLPWVADYDDAVFHNYDRHPNRAVSRVLRGKIDAVMRRAALVIAGNEYLADRAKAAGAWRVEILPSVIDLSRYPSVPPPGNGTFTIGWIGSPTTAKYLCLVERALKEVCRRGRGRVVLVGAGKNPLQGVPAEVHPWTEETEVVEISRFDAGIMPLPDNPWERGKCGFKLIQYMGCWRPAVGSPVGINREIIDDGVNGLHALKECEWVRALDRLMNDRALRESLGGAGRGTVESRYCLQAVAPRLCDLLLSAGGA
jgi:glycosyltransferase involved in cell wall biosynthesis